MAMIKTFGLGGLLGMCLPVVEGRRWWPRAREGIEEARVFAGDEPCHREETRRAAARLYTLQNVIN